MLNSTAEDQADGISDEDVFDLDVRVTTTAAAGAARPCDTSDGCAPTCASACNSAA
jgi:FxLD family lantipeptide